jgi:hypothetical protein
MYDHPILLEMLVAERQRDLQAAVQRTRRLKAARRTRRTATRRAQTRRPASSAVGTTRHDWSRPAHPAAFADVVGHVSS